MPNRMGSMESRIQEAVHEVYALVVAGIQDKRMIEAEIEAAATRHKVPAKDVRAEYEILI